MVAKTGELLPFWSACAKIEIMSLFKRKKAAGGLVGDLDAGTLAQRSLDFIAEAVLVVSDKGMIKFANPAAAAMTGYGDPSNITGLDYQLVIRLENSQGMPVESTQSSLYTAIQLNRALNTREYVLVSAQSERRIAIDLTCIPTGSERADRIITFRDITTELAEEREQTEFISTASHEMRTPVASIEGYLGLALNPQTATIDERAKKYLEAAHAASQHLGHLFKDLLDVTKLDDSRAKVHLIPVDAVEAVKYIANEQAKAMEAKKIRYTFGTGRMLDKKQIAQKIYMAVDYDFLHEIVDNLVGNAIKYTPEGGEIKVTVRGDGDKVLISVADSGIGIPSDDLGHIFQKFYRVDNSQTRQIGGTGLGLYLVKGRAEALGGRVWAESDFGKGSTFFVTLPRISESEYERMSIAYANEKMVQSFSAPKTAAQPIAVPPTPQVATSQPVATVQPAAGSVAPVTPTTPAAQQTARIAVATPAISSTPVATTTGARQVAAPTPAVKAVPPVAPAPQTAPATASIPNAPAAPTPAAATTSQATPPPTAAPKPTVPVSPPMPTVAPINLSAPTTIQPTVPANPPVAPAQSPAAATSQPLATPSAPTVNPTTNQP